jgi:hypothetical protein
VNEDLSPVAESCEHEPDLSSATLTRGRGELYVDVPCKYCGLSGCLGSFTDKSEVQW